MFKRILVPLDGSETSWLALSSAIGLAGERGALLRLVHVLDDTAYLTGYDMAGSYHNQLIASLQEAGQKIVDEGVQRAAAAGIEAECMVFHDLGQRLGETVANAAKLWNADLVVVGTHGRRGLGRVLLGSGAEQIIRVSPVPVLVVRSTHAS